MNIINQNVEFLLLVPLTSLTPPQWSDCP